MYIVQPCISNFSILMHNRSLVFYFPIQKFGDCKCLQMAPLSDGSFDDNADLFLHGLDPFLSGNTTTAPVTTFAPIASTTTVAPATSMKTTPTTSTTTTKMPTTTTAPSYGGAITGVCKDANCIKKVYAYVGIGSLQMFMSGLLQAPTIMILLR